MQTKIKTMISFAVRARKISFGESVLSRKGKVKLALMASDASENTSKKYLDKLSYNQIRYIVYGTKGELGEVVNKNDVCLLGIEDPNIAKEIIKIMKEEN